MSTQQSTPTIVLRNLKIGEAKSLPDIVIGGKEKRTIGRSIDTQITSPTVSREHLMIKPKFDERVLLVRLLGKSPSSINGFVMIQDEAYEAVDGDIINFVFNSDYQYRVSFEEMTLTGKIKRPSQEMIIEEEPKKTKCDIWASLEHEKCLVFTSADCEGREKIAAYDMDNTLIKTVSGLVFPRNIDDWQLNYSSIPAKLKALYDKGFKICVFTNQGGVESGKMTVSEVKRKTAMIAARLAVPCQFFIATRNDKYRKPRIAMWRALEEQFNDEIEIDRSLSFFVGDAAGRPEVKIPKKKKDHSCADRLLALNLNLSFYTPEEHFLGTEKDRSKIWTRPAFNPTTVSDTTPLVEPPHAKLTSSGQEILLLVGYPGSGKSFLCREHLAPAGYEIINRDTLSTQQKCMAAINTAASGGKSCAIDNTNPDPTTRKRYIDEAKRLQLPIRCILFNASYEHAKHNNKFRELTDSSHAKISDMVFNVYKSKYVEPSVREGFDEVIRVNFVPKFDDDGREKLYRMYLLER